MNSSYTIIFSKRKTIALYIKNWILEVRAPKNTNLQIIQNFVASKENWIQKHLSKDYQKPKKIYTNNELKIIKENLYQYILPKITEYTEKFKFLPPYTAVKITKSESRWGSCSSKNRLCFSYRLEEFLEWKTDFIDAVIIHELAHLQEKNHKTPFWNLVFFMMKDYKNIINKYKNI